MKVIDMFVDYENIDPGVFAISVVGNPATQTYPVALTTHEVKLAEVDKKKQILMGALLIPEDIIPRVDEKTKEVYGIKFSKETLFDIIKVYMQKGKQNNTTLEHDVKLDGNTIIEIWQKEDMVHDKSAMYGLSDPVGSIMISMFISDIDKYNKYVSDGKGFSLEGNFTSQLSLKKVSEPCEDAVLLQKVKDLIEAEEQK